MNLKPFAAATLAMILCRGVFAAEQYDGPPEQDAEDLAAPPPDRARTSQSTESASNGERKASLPYSPYPAGLTWVLTPQPFYAQIRHHGLYYPPHTYVRRCPYYPRGYYWGANWRFNVIGRGNLLFLGAMRYNPYLTAAKAEHHKKTRGQKRYVPPPGPIGQAELIGSSGPSAPVALPPISAPGREVEDGADSDYQASSDVAPPHATVRLASPRGSARTASSRRPKSGR